VELRSTKKRENYSLNQRNLVESVYQYQFSEISDTEYENSKIITESLCRNILNQERQCNRDPEINLKKARIKKKKRKKSQQVLDELKHNMNREHLRLLSQEVGSSSWLSTLPLQEEGYHFDKQSFWDLIRTTNFETSRQNF